MTGAATGIGAATVADFCRNGALTVATDIAEPGDELAATLAEHGDRARFERLDVREQADWDRVLAVCKEAYGQPNVLFNNAGALGSGRPIHEETVEGMQAALRRQRDRHVPGDEDGHPGDARAGRRLDRQHVVGVGDLRGAGQRRLPLRQGRGAPDDEERRGHVRPAQHPRELAAARLRRHADVAWGHARGSRDADPVHAHGRRAEPEEVSGMVVYLASDEASFTVGGTFTVDGGMSAL